MKRKIIKLFGRDYKINLYDFEIGRNFLHKIQKIIHCKEKGRSTGHKNISSLRHHKKSETINHKAGEDICSMYNRKKD